jgi:hypothetical protein
MFQISPNDNGNEGGEGCHLRWRSCLGLEEEDGGGTLWGRQGRGWRRRAPREAKLRSMAAARQWPRATHEWLEEENDGGALRGRGRGGGVLRGWGSGVLQGQDWGREVAAVVWWFLGRQKSERECWDEKLLSVARESVGPKILVHGT